MNTFTILGFPLDHELPGGINEQPPLLHEPFVMGMQLLSEEAKRQFTQKNDETIPTLRSMADFRIIYLMVATGQFIYANEQLSLTLNGPLLDTVYKLLSNRDKSEFEVLGKYITAIENLILMYKFGRPMLDFVFDA